MQKKRTLLLSLLLLLGLVISACAAPASPAAPAGEEAGEAVAQEGGTLNMSLGDDFVTFHPFFDLSTRYFKPIFFDPLIRITMDGDFEPWLAESWEMSDDKMSVTLTLTEGVKFHNGREMTAEDVVWSMEHAMDAELGHSLSDRFATATGAEVIDDRTVKINYSEPTASILDGLARLYIFPQEAVETIETNPVGTGPFVFEEWIPGESTTAVKNEEYWREGEPKLDRIVIKPLPDPQSRLINLRTGSIDALMDVPLIEKAGLEAEEGMVVGQVPPGFAFWAFIMNVQEPPFDNKLVRQAFNYAIDRDKMVDTVFYGESDPIVVPYPETSWVYPEDLADYYTYDPEKAMELLAEAGYEDGLTVDMVIRGTSGPHLDTAQVFQQDLAAIGVDLNILPTELPQYWPILFESDFAIVSHATGDATIDPSGLFEGAACCRPFRTFFGYTENQDWFPEYEEVILEARRETDQDRRAELYHRAVEILLEQGWTIPTAWRQEVYAHSDKVENFRVDFDGFIWPQETTISE